MAGGLGLLGLLGAGRLGANFISDRREQSRNSMLQTGIQDALGTAPTIFQGEARPGGEQLGGQQIAGTGTGLLADPNNQQNQLQFASNIFGLPGGQEIASDLLRQAQLFGNSQVEQQAGFEQRDREQESLFGFNEQENALNREARADIAGDKLAQDSYFDTLKLQQDAAQFQFDQNQPPPGMRWANLSPGEGGGRIPVPEVNTAQWQKGLVKQQGIESKITGLDDLITTFKSTGAEAFTGANRGKLKVLHAAAMLGMKDVFDLGVLSEDELAILEDVVQDPTGIGGHAKSNAEILAGYETVMKLLQGRMRGVNREHYKWPGLGSNLDVATPSEQAEQRRVAEATAQAEQLGITVSPVQLQPQQDQQQGGGGLAGRGRGRALQFGRPAPSSRLPGRQ